MHWAWAMEREKSGTGWAWGSRRRTQEREGNGKECGLCQMPGQSLEGLSSEVTIYILKRYSWLLCRENGLWGVGVQAGRSDRGCGVNTAKDW